MNGVVFVAFKELKKKNYVLKNSTAAQVPGTLGNPHTAKRVCCYIIKCYKNVSVLLTPDSTQLVWSGFRNFRDRHLKSSPNKI